LLSIITLKHSFAQLQGQQLIDSIINVLPKQTDDTNKVNLLSALAFIEYSYDPSAGVKYGNQALLLSNKLAWKKGLALSSNGIGACYLSLANYDSALYYFQLSLKMNEETGNKLRAAQNFGNISLIYSAQGNYSNALDYLFRALKIFEDLKDNDGIAIQYGNIGNLYDDQKNFTKAIYYDSLAMEKYKEMGDKDGMATELGNMGNIYDDLGNHDKGLEFDKEALSIFEELGSSEGIARNLGNMSVIYCTQKKFYEALATEHRGMNIYKALNDVSGLSHCYINIADYYYKIASDSANAIKPDSLVPASKQACLNLAYQYARKAIALDSSVQSPNSLGYDYLVLSSIQKAMGDFKAALQSFIKYSGLKDSVFNMDSKVRIEKLTTEREVELKNKQIQIDKLEVAKKKNERIFYIIGIVGLMIVIVLIYRNFRRQVIDNKLLTTEKQKSETLLLNILPEEVAEELKNKGSSEAKMFDNVTVIFTDFVNFTGAGEHMSAQELVDELHTCFKAFDEIIGKYNIEKIKTIGDAYLAVCGLPVADPSHAENIVNAAIDINIFMRQRRMDLHDKTFLIRIGIHSGSVVAGIVGVKKFAYDIWGDTVNTAARMEQNSEAGKINISQTTYELVKDKFNCIYRGEIEAKNKGMMKMYYVG
jgi:class 3 adenylate cyclase